MSKDAFLIAPKPWEPSPDLVRVLKAEVTRLQTENTDLKALAKALLWEVDMHINFANGNTRPCGDIDEGEVLHARYMATLNQRMLKELRIEIRQDLEGS
jgi:hypothetical protein